MLRKIILVTFLPLFMLTGCASSGRVHDKDYLRAVSISGDERKELTLSFFSEDKESVSVSGEDIDSAIEAAELVTGKSVFTGYTELIILGDCNCTEVLSYLLNKWKVSPSCLVAYSRNGALLLRDKDAEQLEGAVKEAAEQGKVRNSDIITVLGKLLNDSEAELPELHKSGDITACIVEKKTDS